MAAKTQPAQSNKTNKQTSLQSMSDGPPGFFVNSVESTALTHPFETTTSISFYFTSVSIRLKKIVSLLFGRKSYHFYSYYSQFRLSVLRVLNGLILVRPTPGGGGTPLFGLYRDVPLDRVWFFGLAVLNRECNLTWLCPKEGQNLS